MEEETDVYTCEWCGFQEDWGDSDAIHGVMWSCEICGKAFCSACFIKKHTLLGYKYMTYDDDVIKCPDCYRKKE